MLNSNGRRRVVITNVSPQIEGGQYPAKAAVHETLTVSADIFSDGHDEIAASVLFKHQNDQKWQEVPMRFVINDKWEAQIKSGEVGFHQYKVQGWVDHFSTWQKGLNKKYEAGQDVSVELLIGAEMIEKALENAAEADRANLTEWASRLRNPDSIPSAVLLALSAEVSTVMKPYRDAELVTVYPQAMLFEVERKKAAYSTWYELFPRSAAAEPGKHGTFNDVKRLLPRVAKMGFDVLYFPPIHPIGEKNRKGKNNSLTPGPDDPGSPWAIGNRTGGHKAIHPELGTLADFRSLVKDAKQLGIEIAMDIAYQCAPDHPYVKEHPQWFKWRPDGSVQYAENPPKKYEDILPINFETEDWQNLWTELRSVVEYWIEQGVTVFRIDNPHTKAFAFWEWMIGEVRKSHPEIIFLAEAFTRPRLMERLAKAGFNQSYTYFTWRNSKWELEEYMRELTSTELRYSFRPNFWPNTPDILPPFLSAGGENAHILRLILAATLSSSYGIYGPVYEFCVNTPHPGKEEYTDNEKYEIKYWDWDKYTRIKEIITRVNIIRKQNPALHTTYNIQFAETSNDQIICYGKADPGSDNRLIIAVNLDPHNTQGAQVRIPLWQLGIRPGTPYTVTDLLSGARYRWQDEWNYVQLNPHEMPAHIFKIEQ
ncbi:alpha-1,4-glucan--maltose-1-phosphate maltosyltransferase [Arcticibacter sp. MXS-1]|uniref:alpha-1,4-glucan--maltose-1-phosphate maltosyltransferase n=1 Tax=Arcticibacter sp. MXS-1 TaxID=3341726 RepID=UPI0035A8614E